METGSLAQLTYMNQDAASTLIHLPDSWPISFQIFHIHVSVQMYFKDIYCESISLNYLLWQLVTYHNPLCEKVALGFLLNISP